MTNQILMAAARGARVQVKDRSGWNDEIIAVRIKDDFYAYRIHPDDEHLRFGSISSALREMAKDPKKLDYIGLLSTPHFGFAVEHETVKECAAVVASPELVHSLFLLILSEALADEGL